MGFHKINFETEQEKAILQEELRHHGKLISSKSYHQDFELQGKVYRVLYISLTEIEIMEETEEDDYQDMMNRTDSLILMTALVPTTGHLDLIRFARSISGRTHIIVSERAGEPTRAADRIDTMLQDLGFGGYSMYIHTDDNAPQNPSESESEEVFWQYWKDVVADKIDLKKLKCVVASEKYGVKLAQILKTEFVPYDIARAVNSVTGTNVRRNPEFHFRKIIPAFREKFIVTRGVLFGQESVGKTTIGKQLQKWECKFIPEYAREYLETVGPELTKLKMQRISEGQLAFQKAAAEGHKIIYDTDLFSTIGYYRILGWDVPTKLVDEAIKYQSEVYYALPDADVPFVTDALRYGGDKRQSTKQFWLDLAQEFSLEVVLVPEGSKEDKTMFIGLDMHRKSLAKLQEIRNFVRT